MTRAGRGYPSNPTPSKLPTVPRGFAEGGPVLPDQTVYLDEHLVVPIDRDPHARVTKAGRWIYHIVIIDGLMQIGPDGGSWLAWGRSRAMRKAERKLLNYLRDHDRAEHPIIIRAESLLKRRFLEAQETKPEP